MQLLKFVVISIAIFVVVICAPSYAQEVGVLHLRPLHLELPATWKFDGSKRPIEGTGPDGEKVLISVFRSGSPTGSGQLPSAKETAKGFVRDHMGQLASKGGKSVIRPITEMPMPDGKAGFSSGSEASNFLSGKSYFVQYLVAASDVIIYFTFEGKGDAKPAMERFDEIFKTQSWDE